MYTRHNLSGPPMLSLRCALLFSVFWHIHVQSQNNRTEIYKKYCPYAKLCADGHGGDRDESDIPPGYRPCCLPCYCDAKCRVFQDCCPDAPVPSQEISSPKPRCALPVYRGPTLIKHEVIIGTVRFPLVDRCPDEYEGPLLKKCMEEFEELPSFDDIKVVSDGEILTRAYKNIHCATCNGVTNTTPWTVGTGNCLQGVEAFSDHTFSISDIKVSMLDTCLLESRPMSAYPVRILACLEPTNNECQTYPDDTSPDIAEACSAFPAPPYKDMEKVTGVQLSRSRNVFCNYCELKRDNITVAPLCQTDLMQSRDRVSSMNLFLNIKPDVLTDETAPREYHNCGSGRLYDGLTNQCRPFQCHWYTGVFGSKCVTYGDVDLGCIVYVNVVLIPAVQTTLSNSTMSAEEFTALQNEFYKMVNLSRCSFAISSVYVDLDERDVYVGHFKIVLRHTTNGACPYALIFQRYRDRLAKPWQQRLKIGGKSCTTKARLSFFSVHNRNQNLKNLYSNTYSLRLRRCTQFMSMFLCPHFSFNVSEYSQIMELLGKRETIPPGNMTIVTAPHVGFYPVSSHTLVVCTDTYFAITSGESATFSAECLQVMQSVCVIVLIGYSYIEQGTSR